MESGFARARRRRRGERAPRERARICRYAIDRMHSAFDIRVYVKQFINSLPKQNMLGMRLYLRCV